MNSIKEKLTNLIIPLLSFCCFACIDHSGESDLTPQLPTNVAEGSDDSSSSEGVSKDNGIKFPNFGGVLAFPGAEGYGRNAVGGRDGEVYHVTNLNNDGKGSFRDAVSKSYRIIVFDVSGIINLNSTPIVLKNNQTILGQTAPGDGVVLYGGRVSASGASNTIVRYLRIRMGAKFSSQSDACGVANGSNIIFDHCSISWGKDENFSINSDNKGTRPQNITIQNSIIAQGLQNHSCGGLIQTDITEGITIYRNLYIDNKTRNPKVKGLNQFVNNVIYNWGNGGAYNMGGDSSGKSETTIEDNYFIVGPGRNFMGVAQSDGSIVTEESRVSPTKPFIEGNADFNAFLARNYYDNNKNGLLDGREIIWETDCSGSPTFLSSRSQLHPAIVNQLSATKAYEWIVQNAGASLPKRDQVDSYLIEELTSLGVKGTIIRNETDTQQFPLGGPGIIVSSTSKADTDNDGMPDEFEDKWGLDKNNPSDAMKKSNNGYTNIENYSFSFDFPKEYNL